MHRSQSSPISLTPMRVCLSRSVGAKTLLTAVTAAGLKIKFLPFLNCGDSGEPDVTVNFNVPARNIFNEEESCVAGWHDFVDGTVELFCSHCGLLKIRVDPVVAFLLRFPY
nr:MAG TPA: hypothetical protein [Caudoviricetes sp.]